MSRIRALDMPLDEIESHFYLNTIPQEWLDRVDAKCKPHYAWLLPGGEAYCDTCGTIFSASMLEKSSHKAITFCPKCAEDVEVRKSWVGQNPARRNALSYHFSKSIINKNIVTCTVIFTCYGYDSGKEPWGVEPLRLIDGLYVFIPGRGTAYASPWRMYPADIRCIDGRYAYKNTATSIYSHASSMEVRKSITEREVVYQYSYTPETGVYAFDDTASLYQATQGTPLMYAVLAYKDAYKNLLSKTPYKMPIVLMAERLAKYPGSLEKVAKMGLGEMYLRYVYFIGSTYSVNHILNLRGRDVPAIFKGQITKSDKKYLYENGASPEEFETWQKLRKAGRPMSMEMVCRMVMKWDYASRTVMLDVMLHINLDLQKVKAYLSKQKKKYKIKAPYSTYADYLKDCIRLSDDYGMGHIYNLADKSILFPQNLHQAHQTTIELIAIETERRRALDAQRREAEIAKQLADMEKKYKKIRPKLEEKYSYQADGYAIIIPPNVEDFTREGLEMHNCVGGYKERVASGSTQVVYIRKLDDMDKSFGTMEISTRETIIQARGKYNKDLPEDAEAFVEKFEHEVLEPLRTIAISLDGVA